MNRELEKQLTSVRAERDKAVDNMGTEKEEARKIVLSLQQETEVLKRRYAFYGGRSGV